MELWCPLGQRGPQVVYAKRLRSRLVHQLAASRRCEEGQLRAPYSHLLDLADQHSSSQAQHLARFLGSTFDGEAFPLNPYDLGALDVAISDDMLCCLNALRWGKASLHTLVPDGEKTPTARA